MTRLRICSVAVFILKCFEIPFFFLILVKPEMVVASRPDPISITEGETVQLNCTAYSNPSPAYRWIGPHNATVGNDSVLTIHVADFQHIGQYVCVASNDEGSATIKFNVDVRWDILPLIAGLSALGLVAGIFIGGSVFCSYYKKMALVLRLSFLLVCLLHMLYGLSERCGDPECVVGQLPKINPSRIVLQYGTPFSVNCSYCNNSHCYDNVQWEMPLGSDTLLSVLDNGVRTPIKQRTVPNATEWGMAPQCSMQVGRLVCCTPLDFTLYKLPENVSISFVNHLGPLLEGRQYTLQCRVEKVAPVQNLTVTFYRGDTMLDSVQSSMSSVKTPVTEMFTVSINSSREDNGVQYRCKTELNLGQQGPQNTTEGPHAAELTTTVYFKPEMVVASRPDPISITEGETVQLNCTAYSNPSPAYRWIGPHNATVGNDSVLTIHVADFQHIGQYVCVASNDEGSATIKFNVDVRWDILPLIAGLSALGLVAGIFIGGSIVYTQRDWAVVGGDVKEEVKLVCCLHLNPWKAELIFFLIQARSWSTSKSYLEQL
ncbi:Vascular cell adhesion protein 1 [Merluccius polli]|uniref:Vascular cell adhesion protein 1 n=1 Tax=Merluccius polli TaxID=89951 RepID=A0AA47MBZ4_MERPO|nr:Vascular cell adhesion protein 1 [Merluccius polli]